MFHKINFKKGQISMTTIVVVAIAIISLLIIILFMTKQADKGDSLTQTLGNLFSSTKR